jgi:ABC-type anion transport system duplicated permease subunit
MAGELVPATRVPEEYPLLWEGRQPAGRVTTLVVVVVCVAVVTLVEVDVSVEVVTLVCVVVSVEVTALVRVVVCVEVVTDVAVTVVGGRDMGTRIRVADTRTPATNIAAATYTELLFPLPCNARPLDSNDGALPSVNTFVQTARP